MCSMSSNSSIPRRSVKSLHLVEHIGDRGIELVRFLDFVGAHVRVYPVFQETRALMFANELDERRYVGFPIFREALEVHEDGSDAGLREEGDGILSVFVEVGVEDSLIHKVGLTFDVEEHPAQVVQLQHGESVGKAGNCFFDLLPILADGVLSAGLDLRDDREAITRGGLGKDGAISSLLEFEVSLLGDRHGGGFCPIDRKSTRLNS